MLLSILSLFLGIWDDGEIMLPKAKKHKGDPSTSMDTSGTVQPSTSAKANNSSGLTQGNEAKSEVTPLCKAFPSIPKMLSPNEKMIVIPIRRQMEIEAGKLYYLPQQHSLESLMCNEVLRQLLAISSGIKNFKLTNLSISPLMMTNPIVLSDNIKTSSTGVTEVSSFVQNKKIYVFKLGSNNDQYAYRLAKINNLNYNIKYTNGVLDGNSDILYLHPTTNYDAFLRINNNYLLSNQDYLKLPLIAPFTGKDNSEDVDIEAVWINKCIDKEKKEEFGKYIDYSRSWENIGCKDFSFCGFVPKTDISLDELPGVRTRTENNAMLHTQPDVYIVNSGDVYNFATSCNYNLGCSPKKFSELFRPKSREIGSTTKTKIPIICCQDGKYTRATKQYELYGPLEVLFQKAMNNSAKTHEYISMVPIRTSTGELMKIRSTVTFTQELVIRFNADSANVISEGDLSLPLTTGGDEGSRANVSNNLCFNLPLRQVGHYNNNGTIDVKNSITFFR